MHEIICLVGVILFYNDGFDSVKLRVHILLSLLFHYFSLNKAEQDKTPQGVGVGLIRR